MTAQGRPAGPQEGRRAVVVHTPGCELPSPMVTRKNGGEYRVDRCVCGAEAIHRVADAKGGIPVFDPGDYSTARNDMHRFFL